MHGTLYWNQSIFRIEKKENLNLRENSTRKPKLPGAKTIQENSTFSMALLMKCGGSNVYVEGE